MNFKKCCFTGNRAFKLPWKHNERDKRCLRLKEDLKKEIIKLIQNGYNFFLCGMAQGIDTYCAEIILDLKLIFPYLILECAIPCKEQTKNWLQKDIVRYNSILSQADKSTYIFETYNKFCNQARNKYMVNNSELILAVWNQERKGGTWNTVQHAYKCDKKINVINLNFY